jgi:hypothetical protein
MRKIKNILLCLVAGVTLFTLTGCSQLEAVVNKTYSLTVKVEKYVAEVDTSKLIQTIENLKIPVSILKSSVEYINGNIKDPEISANMIKVSETLGSILTFSEVITEENADAQKEMLLSKIQDVRTQIENVASSMGIELVVPKTGDVTFDEIIFDSENLEALIN